MCKIKYVGGFQGTNPENLIKAFIDLEDIGTNVFKDVDWRLNDWVNLNIKDDVGSCKGA